MKTGKNMMTRFVQAALPFAAVLLLALTMVVVTSATATQAPTTRSQMHDGLPAGSLAPFLSGGMTDTEPAQLQFDFNG